MFYMSMCYLSQRQTRLQVNTVPRFPVKHLLAFFGKFKAIKTEF